MPITLTTPVSVPNGTRLVVDKVRCDDEASEMTIVLQLRSPAGTDNVVSEKVLTIRNGSCDRVSRGVPGSLQGYAEFLSFGLAGLTVAAGYDNAVAIWRAGTTPQARRNALEAHLLSVGYIHSSLTGT